MNTLFARQIAAVDEEHFTAYQGGWTNSAAKVVPDAVYSIRAVYTTSTGKGVSYRLSQFKDTYPDVLNDLEQPRNLGADTIAETMAHRPKAEMVVEVAGRFVDKQLRAAGAKEVTRI